MRNKSFFFLKLSLYASFLGFLFAGIFIFPRSAQALTRKAFDFVVGVDGNFKEAMAAAAKSASAGNRFYIFFPDGDYDIGTLTGNSNQMTTFPTSNVSFIGQSADKTVVYNKSSQEGISVTATLYFNKANNLYLQDLTILNKACYGNPSTYSTTSRHVAVMEQGNDIIYKNVKLLSTQDTYYTKGNRTYWENGEIHGTTDFICGGGDILFNKCLIYTDKISDLTAPATSTTWGYVFLDCTIDGSVSSYLLGRAWNNSPKCVYINTTMKKTPSAAGWGDPMNVVPSLFAEYNSKTASGSAVDLSGRRKTYSLNGSTVTINPVLTADQAAKYTIANIMGDWKPDNLARQAGAPTVSQEGSTLKWNDDAAALCWAVFKDNKFFKCVTTASCDIGSDAKTKYTVRAANAMGGLGPVSTFGTGAGSPRRLSGALTASFTFIYNHSRKSLSFRTAPSTCFMASIYALDGSMQLSRKFILGSGADGAEWSLSGLKNGNYIVKCESGGAVMIGRLYVV
jgi:pectin methylesterase-like acyl-CoA thioesterase